MKDSAGNSKTVVTADGKIGVGTSAPTRHFDAVSDVTSAIFGARSYSDVNPAGRSVYLMERARGSKASPSLLADGDWVGSFQANGYIGESGFYAAAGINFIVDGTPVSELRPPGKIVFTTSLSGGALQDRMTIKNDGNVGVGTSTPGQKLEVNGGVRINTVNAQPTCDSTIRGTFWYTQNNTGIKDKVEVCAKDAGDAYAWRTLW